MEPPGESGESNFNQRIFSDSENYGHRRSLSSNDIAALKSNIEKEVKKSKLRPTGSTQDLSETKFVSVVAKAMYHFQEDTPSRFQSTGPNIFKSLSFMRHQELTRSQSPKLRCEDRSRPVHDNKFVSVVADVMYRFQEDTPSRFQSTGSKIFKSLSFMRHQELTRSQSPKLAYPIPKFVLEEEETKQLDDKLQSFQDTPPPKHVLQSLQVPTEIPARITKSCSPKLHYQKPPLSRLQTPVSKRLTPASLTKKPARCHSPVIPIPFSFEKRNEHLRKLKEEKIKRQIEEERKQATQFKANPVPEGVKKRMQSVSSKSGSSTLENKENHHVIFKAKSPIVLYKEPFKPVLQPVQVVQPVPFQLSTEKRVIEREKFNSLLKEKEEIRKQLRLQKEYEIQRAEEQAIAELRAKQVHRAKPAPAFVQRKKN